MNSRKRRLGKTRESVPHQCSFSYAPTRQNNVKTTLDHNFPGQAEWRCKNHKYAQLKNKNQKHDSEITLRMAKKYLAKENLKSMDNHDEEDRPLNPWEVDHRTVENLVKKCFEGIKGLCEGLLTL